jgi:hypothetical protein
VTFSDRIWQLLIAIDQTANTAISLFIGDGWADETLSARAYRMRWHKTIAVIDSIFFLEDQHCRDAYESERLRRHLPPEYRQVSS